MMNNSSSLFKRSCKVTPGGVHSPVRAFKSVGGSPIFFKSAEGAYITSVDNTQYIDFCQSFGPNILGHRDPDVAEIVRHAVEQAWSLGACEPHSLELAEWITERLPWVEKLRFVCSGTEAVMSVLRLARAATGRDKILKCEGCYHGHADAMLVKAGSGLAGDAASDSAGVSEQVAKSTLVIPLDDEKAAAAAFASYGDEIAAIIIEPVPANYGLLIQRKEYLQRLCDLARENGSLVIFDEVISGFRVALGGMAEKLSITPDLVTYGKIIGGGFPVGAYAGKAELLDLIAPNGPVYQAGTLAANPIGMMAGLATLKKIESQNVYSILEKRCDKFCKTLEELFKEHNAPFSVTHIGSLFWIHSKSEKPIRTLADIPDNHSEEFSRFFQACLKNGIYFAPSGFEVSFLSFAHDETILKIALLVLNNALKEIYR